MAKYSSLNEYRKAYYPNKVDQENKEALERSALHSKRAHGSKLTKEARKRILDEMRLEMLNNS